MARVSNTLWNRYKYKINGLVICFSFYYLYQSLFPQFPDVWETKKIGGFEVAPMPYDLEAPYLHDGVYSKDFLLIFKQGRVDTIRQAYLNIGVKAIPLSTLQSSEHGILHGSQHGQEVHAIAPKVLSAKNRVWLTIENWQGEQFVTSWAIPKALLNHL